MRTVYLHRKILESEAVSRRIHVWFTNVFGQGNHGSPYCCFNGAHPPREVFSRPPYLHVPVEYKIGADFDSVDAVVVTEDQPFVFHFWACSLKLGRIQDFTVSPRKFCTIPQSTSSTLVTRRLSEACLGHETGVIRANSVLNRTANNGGEPSLNEFMAAITGKSIAKVSDASRVITRGSHAIVIKHGDPTRVIDLMSGKTHEIDTGTTNRVTDVDADGVWMITGDDNAELTLVREWTMRWTIRLFRESVTACAVSSVFNVIVGGTQDSSLIFCSTVTCSIIRVINLPVCDSGVGVVPRKILITPSWGFVVVYCSEIVGASMKHYILVYTINGQFVHRTELDCCVDYWRSFTSNSGFDYIVFASDCCLVYFSEVYYLNKNSVCLFNCKARIVSSFVSPDTSTLVVVTKQGQVTFIPIVM